MEPEMTLETAHGVGGSNDAIIYQSDAENQGPNARRERESAVWSRARRIVDAYDAYCEEHEAYEPDDMPDGRLPSPDWCYTQMGDDDNDVNPYIVLADSGGIIAIYFLYEGPSEDDEENSKKLLRLPRKLWPLSIVKQSFLLKLPIELARREWGREA
jgi:hypothetical protein